MIKPAVAIFSLLGGCFAVAALAKLSVDDRTPPPPAHVAATQEPVQPPARPKASVQPIELAPLHVIGHRPARHHAVRLRVAQEHMHPCSPWTAIGPVSVVRPGEPAPQRYVRTMCFGPAR